VAHPDRIHRSESRRDSGKESAFARQLRRRREDPDSQDPHEDQSPPEPAPSTELRAGTVQTDADGQPAGSAPAKRMIDVRV
jgi:hypothetical protein